MSSKAHRLWVVAIGAVLAAVGLAACTATERDGYSPIPQNSPGSWEMRPYNIRN